MNGYELAACLRWASLIGGKTRIVAATVSVRDGNRGLARQAGFDAHVFKPVSLNALMRAME
jgi:CheY-like chemotaxis protein